MSKYKSEKEFLNDYDSSIYEKLSVTSDILIISVSRKETKNYRKNDQRCMSILLVKREEYPYKDKWCLPGGFLDPTSETLEECAKRVLKRETNLSDIYLDQLYTFDSIKRDPRLRVISTAFMALIDKDKLKEEVHNASWFDIMDITDNNNVISILLTNGEENIEINVNKKLRDETTNKFIFTSKNSKDLAFDHDAVIVSGLWKIKDEINSTDIIFNMMPKYFTLKDLQQVYEIVLNKKLLDPAFRRIIANKVKKTNRKKIGEGHRPSYLYTYKKGSED